MSYECSEETILDFLRERGGKVKNADFIEHFKSLFPEEPGGRAAARERFKTCVDGVAFVKSESGVKYVCLKKKFRASINDERGAGRGKGALKIQPTCSDGAAGGGDDAAAPAPQESRAAGSRAQRAAGSGYGNDTRGVPHFFASENTFPEKTEEKSKCHEFECVVDEVDSGPGEMGNIGSGIQGRRVSKRAEKDIQIPEIAVIEASPLPAEDSMFTLPGPAQTGTTGIQVDTTGLDRTGRQAETRVLTVEGPEEAEDVNVARQHQGGSLSGQSDYGEDERHSDACSLSGSDDNSTPKGSRKHFLELMVNSSPQLRRSVALRNSVNLSSKCDGSDTSSVYDDRSPVTLEPVEHEWMMCASDGEWAGLRHLLDAEPALVLKKDFVTGFTCLHWAAKHGKPELIALIANFAERHGVPVSVDVRSNAGYTPLHIAAMHSHMEVVKLLVGAYDADVEIRDYSGKKACQYLTDNVSVDIRDIIGAYETSASNNEERKNGRWRFSKVLQSNVKPIKLLSPDDSVDGEVRHREKPVRRKSSLSRMKPALQKLRFRTSQLVDSASFGDKEELEKSKKSRPKTHFFGWDR